MPATLSEKLKLRLGQRAAVLNAPPGYLQQLTGPTAGQQVDESLSGKYGWLQVFVRNKAELTPLVPQIAAALEAQALLWIAFPKGSSKIQTDLTRDKGWEPLQAADLKWINLVSVDETWSAFCLRPYRLGEPRQSWR